MDMINGCGYSAADQGDLLSADAEVEAEMAKRLTADSDLYERILQNQPIVLLKRIKIDKLPKHGSHPADDEDDQMESSGSEYNMDCDSDEDWTEHGLSKRRCRIHCLFCFSSYRRQSDLDNHVRVTHGDDCMPFICASCGRGFMQQKSLFYHARRKSCKANMKKIHQMNDTQRMIQVSQAGNAATSHNSSNNEVIRCKNRQTCHNSAMIDTPLSSSEHNSSSDHLQVKGVKLHFNQSRQLCAKVIYAEARGESFMESSPSHRHNVPSLNELPSFHSEGELMSYLREKSEGKGRGSVSCPIACPVCNKSVTEDILGHLRHHKQVLKNCKRQKRYLCDVCFIDADSIEWMIRHQKQSHGKSLPITSCVSDEQNSTDGTLSDRVEGAIVSCQLPELDSGPQCTKKEPLKLNEQAVCTNFSDAKTNCGDHTISQHSASVTNFQNVIEIKPVSDESNPESTYDACFSHKNAISDSRPLSMIKNPLQTIADCHSVVNPAGSGSEANQSPGPPVLYPPMNDSPLTEESSCEMPELHKESDGVNNMDEDLLLVCDTKPSQKKRFPVTVKQEKDADGYRCEIQQSAEKVSKAGKTLSERSFMDALIPTLEPICAASNSNVDSFSSIIPSSRDSCLSSVQTGFVDSDKNNHVLHTSVQERMRETSAVDAWQTSELANNMNGRTYDASNCMSDSNLNTSLQQSACARNMHDVGIAVDTMQQQWAVTEKHSADSTESDSGVSEVKLEDEELQDEVIVIDLDERSVVRECITSDTGAERSLQPAEHKAMLKVKEEDKNLAAESYLQMLENDKRVTNDKQKISNISSPLSSASSLSSPSSSSSSVPSLSIVTTDSQERHRDAVNEEERSWMLEKQKELFENLERFLHVISDKPAAAAGQSNPGGAVQPKTGHLPRGNSCLYNSARERHQAKQQTRLLLNCDICGKGFQSIGLLNKHKRFTHTDQNLKTNSIGSKQDTVKALAQPMGDLKLRAYPCSKCGEYFPSLALLHEHKKTVHKLTSKYLCLQCDKSFSSRGQLQSHTRWKHTRTKDKSPAMPASVITKAMLKQGCFPNIPSNDKSYSLSNKNANDWGLNSEPPQDCKHDCGSKITEPSLIASSSMQAPDYMCTLCGKTFISLDDRLRHKRLFCQVKKLSCGQCGKSFSHSSSLVKHTKKHENVRYVCDVCGLAYMSVYSVKLHRQRQHPEAPTFNAKWLKVELDQMPDRLSR